VKALTCDAVSTISRPRAVDVNLRSGPQLREYEAIVEQIAGMLPGRVLDWGCGHGQISHMLGQRGVEVESYDFVAGSEPTVVTLEHFPDVQAHVSGDPVRLPFAEDQFDTVLSCGVLEHVQQPGESLDELHRVLRPAGRLLIYKLPNRLSYLEAIARRAGMYYHGALPDDRVYDRRTATALVEAHGFRVDDFRRMNMLPLTVEHPLAWRFSGAIWAANRGLAHVPGLSLLSTNVELDATALGS
jgi:2-polyprenyl-3-methyl-5-hydroxy-6-metoxy-1,4-benzoquinol methylase